MRLICVIGIIVVTNVVKLVTNFFYKKTKNVVDIVVPFIKKFAFCTLDALPKFLFSQLPSIKLIYI